MPALDKLIPDAARRERLLRAAQLPHGIVAVNGGVRSGKTTTLFALADALAASGTHVTVMASDPHAFKPDNIAHWEFQIVENSPKAWRAAMQAALARGVAVPYMIDQQNAAAVVASAAEGGRVLTQIDTPFVGIDVAYSLDNMGVSGGEMLATFACIVSQALVPRLCGQCGAKRRVPAEDAALIYPGAIEAMELWDESDCPACQPGAKRPLEPLHEILAIDEDSRPILREYLDKSVVRRPLRGGHFTMQESARELVRQGLMGLRTYKREIFHNPNLRLNHQWEQESERAARMQVESQHKTEFLANMSHELRTPLNAIIGFSEALLERMFGELNEKQAEYLKDIHSSGKHLLALINDILDLSKIEAGHMELERTRFDLKGALETALALLRERALRHGIGLVLNADGALGEIDADERKLKQVLLNLLSNAVKFTPDGGRIELAARRLDGQVHISVRDSGIGISTEDQARLFREFQQVGTDSARKAEGTGLGLALTKQLVELHGGRITVRSAPGEGSTFTVTLPA